MTTQELIHYLDTIIAQAADGPPEGPRPQGTFVGTFRASGLTGLRLTAPDGTTFYLAVLEAGAFETPTQDDIDAMGESTSPNRGLTDPRQPALEGAGCGRRLPPPIRRPPR